MYKYILKRLLWMIPIILAVTIVIFTIMYFVPGDIAKIILGTNASDEAYAALRERLGLNDPYFIRLLNYLKDVFLHFNFGESVVDGTSVTSALISRFPATLILAFTSILMSIAFGIPLGIVAAQHNGKWQDTTSMFIALPLATFYRNWDLAALDFAGDYQWVRRHCCHSPYGPFFGSGSY